MKSTLLTGATGYVGAHLLKVFEANGVPVRCLVRNPNVLAARVAPTTKVLQGDVFDEASLDRAMEGVSTAYYLVHSMGASGNFESKDRIAAENFARAAKRNGVERVIYLGGLAHSEKRLSAHLKSRLQVGEILRKYGPQVVEFRASIIIGAGSLSFEMVRALTERLPIMITPKWVSQWAQPIAIDDVIRYLVMALEKDFQSNSVFEIGGETQISYGGLMKEYARQRGLKRFMIPVPFLTPRLSSLWLGLITPLYARVGRKLVDSLMYETVVRDNSAIRFFGFTPRGPTEAIRTALRSEDKEMADARWFDALSSAGHAPHWGGVRFGSRIVDSRSIRVPVNAAEAFRPIQLIGGNMGWYYATWLWKLRGWIDLLVGGVGTRRGRTSSKTLRVGDVIDWWRIEAVRPGSHLLLSAEMRVPGRAWLQYDVIEEAGVSEIRQTAIYDPVGLAGLIYWYALYPIHHFIFNGMLRQIGQRAMDK